MGTAVLILSAAYALPLALAALALSRVGVRSRVTVAVLVALPLFYLAHYLGLRQLAGWPVDAAPPERFNLLAERVQEPDRKAGTAGAVYLWVNTSEAPQPRAFELPYSKSLHTQLAAASQRRAAGNPQLGLKREPGKVGSSSTEVSEGRAAYRFSDRPERRLPSKGATDPAG